MPTRQRASQQHRHRNQTARQRAASIDDAVLQDPKKWFKACVRQLEQVAGQKAILFEGALRPIRRVVWPTLVAACCLADECLMSRLQLMPVKAADWWHRPLAALLVVAASIVWCFVKRTNAIPLIIATLALATLYVECRRPLGVEARHAQASSDPDVVSGRQRKRATKGIRRQAKADQSSVKEPSHKTLAAPAATAEVADRSLAENASTAEAPALVTAAAVEEQVTDTPPVREPVHLQVPERVAPVMRTPRNRLRAAFDEALTSQSLPLVIHQACSSTTPAWAHGEMERRVESCNTRGRTTVACRSNEEDHLDASENVEPCRDAASPEGAAPNITAAADGGTSSPSRSQTSASNMEELSAKLAKRRAISEGYAWTLSDQSEPSSRQHSDSKTDEERQDSETNSQRFALVTEVAGCQEEPVRQELQLQRSRCRPERANQRNGHIRAASIDAVRLRTPPKPVNAGGSESVLQADMDSCEREFTVLTRRLEELRTAGTSSSERHSQPEALATSYAQWRTACQALVDRLRNVASEALECGCNRVLGAMDVFEQANSTTERLATLLGEGAGAEVEASAPALCNAVEWRVVADAIGASELQLLRELLLKVHDCEKHPACLSNGRMLNQSPATLLRFLRAKDANVDEAAQMFYSTLHWRWTSTIDEKHDLWMAEESAAKTWRAKLVQEFKVHKELGQDRFGLPVYLFRWSVFDVAGAERELGTDVVVQIMISIHEEIVRAMGSAILQRRSFAPGCMQVWDVGNYGIHGGANWWSRMLALVRFLPKVAKIMEQNYPEVVRKIVIVRSSATTRALYRTLTPFMPSKTLDKGHLFGWCPEEWLKEIREEAPGLPLPAFLCSNQEEALAKAEPKGGIWREGVAEAFQAGTAR